MTSDERALLLIIAEKLFPPIAEGGEDMFWLVCLLVDRIRKVGENDRA